MGLKAKQLYNMLSFNGDIVVENTSSPPGTVVLGTRLKLLAREVITLPESIKDSYRTMVALRSFLGSGVLTLRRPEASNQEHDPKNRRREAILAQRQRNG